MITFEEEHDQKSIRRDSFLNLLKEIWKEKLLLAGGGVFLIITTATAVYEPRFLGQIIDETLTKKNKSSLELFAALFFLLQAARVLTLIAHTYLFSKLGQNVMQTLRDRLFEKLQTLPVQTFNKVPIGKLVTRVTNDVSSLADMFTAGFITILGNILFAVGIIAWLLVLNFRLGVISLIILPPLLLASMKFSQLLKITYREARSKLSALNAYLAENILGMRVILLFNRQQKHTENFKRLNHQYAEAQFASVKVFSLFQPAITMATGISMALLIWYGSASVIEKQITIGFLASYFAYVLSLFQPIREIADKWNIFLAGMASVERIFSILDWESEKDLSLVSTPAHGLTEIKGHIEFKNVWFAYENENWILRDFSFEILPRSKIGIVGPTGSGKTTLINLLLRLYDPQKGEILLDGKPLSSYDKRNLRSSIGLIQQDVFLFSGSLAENMTLWRTFDPQVKMQLNTLAAFQNFENKGLDTENSLNERGNNLSIGERQVLAFARALHTKPQLWILDEATSNMDSETEKEIEQILLKTSKSLITIAHRLASVREADTILVLQHGTLVEQGTHKELMSCEGLYSRLYKFQEMN